VILAPSQPSSTTVELVLPGQHNDMMKEHVSLEDI
jgi:hypothetical protein